MTRDGGLLELVALGYEQVALEVHGVDVVEVDDWLVVRGRVRLADHREWTFVNSCLTTVEARGLGEWLLAVAEGRVRAEPPSVRSGMLRFTEPNLGFGLDESIGDQVRVRLHLSHESLPPWNSTHEWPDYQAYFVVLSADTGAVRPAAMQWLNELDAFPTRCR